MKRANLRGNSARITPDSMKGTLAFLLIALSLGAAPRRINDAEREAVTIVAAFLARGPEAIEERLSADAPLRVLPQNELLAELAVRTGPRDGARWTLQTATGGRDGDVAFRVTYTSGYEDGLLFRMQKNGLRWSLREVLTLAEDPMRRADAPPPRSRSGKHNKAIALVLAIVGALLLMKSRALGAVVLVIAAIALFFPRSTTPPQRNLPFVELRSLLPLREALARGEQPQDIPDAARDVGELWVLQSGARSSMPDDDATRTPLLEVMQARVAIAKGRMPDAKAAYQRAMAIEPQRDDIYYEALPFLEDSQFEDSRDPRIHYARAMRDGSNDALRTAWSLEPVMREELVRDSRLFPLLLDARTMSMVSLYSAEEPEIRHPLLGSQPIAVPSRTRAFAKGGFLTIQIGDAAIDIPGGASLAPANVRVVSATRRKQDEVETLADHNRWAEIAKLTEDITPRTLVVSPRLLLLRMRALLRTDRLDDARELAEGSAITEAATKLVIADTMANQREWEIAEKLYRAAGAPEQRLRQLELRRKLTKDGVTLETPQFNVRHDPTMNPAIAARIGELLEAELARLLQTFPLRDPRRVTVNVFYWDDFRGSITGGDHILGLYDGEISLPFGVVNQFTPELVAVLTHELTHALIAQATSDNAPRWFQEGLAQHMEQSQHANVFDDTAPERVLPISLLDAVMESSTDFSMTADGYRVSQTFIRYLEDRYASSIPTLIAAFAAGKNSEEALREVTGKSLGSLSGDFRQWGSASKQMQ